LNPRCDATQEVGTRRGDVLVASLLAVAAAVALVAAAAQVAGFEFLLWDDDRIVHSLLGRDTAWPSRLAWLLDPFTTQMQTPAGVAAWGLLADAFGVVPRPFHVAALAAHAASVLLLALVCRALLALTRPAPGGGAPAYAWTASVAAAAVWGLHPLRAEAVGWMAAMAYPLSTALGLAALLIFLRAGMSARARAGLGLAAVLYVLACLTHPQVTALCVVFFLVDLSLRPRALRRGTPPRWVGSRLAWHGALLAVAVAVSGLGVALRTGDRPPASSAYLLQQVTKVLGFAGEFTLFHAWVPLHTSLVYPGYDAASWGSAPFLLGVAALLALAAWGWRRGREGKPGLRVAVLAHLAFAVPASGLFLEVYNRGDRYVGAVTVVAAVVAGHVFRDVLARGRGALAAVAAVLLVVVGLEGRALGAALARWRDTPALMEHLIATAPDLRWKLFAGVRIVQHWQARDDAARARGAVVRLMELPQGPEQERVVRTTRYLLRTGHCPEAAVLLDARAGLLGAAERDALANEVRRCAPGS
jgi:hypothetical protein